LVQVNSDLSDYAAPSLLTSWAPSDNGFTWTFNVRHGVKWHDGEEFTADDIIFSLHSLMNANTGSQFVGYYQNVYGNNVAFTYSDGTTTSLGTGTKMGTIKALDKYTVQAKIPELTGGKPFGYFDPYLLGLGNNIIAKHIFENIEPAQWSGTPFNTGQGEIVIKGKTYTGPVGTGPYKWGGFDPVTQLVTLLKNTEYWDRAALEAEGNFGVQKYYIKFIADKTPAIAALKNGQVDILDPNYEMNVDAKTVDPAWATVVQQDGAGRQELGYNMQHPIWGTGVDTPLGKATPARAAEAARYVRQAFDYAIPRQLVIDNLMDGSGLPGCTAMLPTQAFYNSAVTARPYNLTLAKSLLTKAGYKVPGYTPVNPPPTPPPPTPPPTGGTTIQPVSVGGFLQGMSSVITGTYTISGNPVANRELWLMASGTDKDYQTAAVFLDKTMTDLSGYYTFTVTPTKAGSTYYFIFDRMGGAGSEWTAAGKLDVITLNDAFKPVTTALADVQNKAQATQTAATAIQADVTALKTSVAALQTSLTAVQQSNTQLSTKIDNLTSQLTAANASATNAMYVGAGGILVALGVGVWVMMKKKEDE
jgi:ABC-type transport system substrate-binding protein